MISLSEILGENCSLAMEPTVFIDDMETLDALEKYQRGKELEKESKILVEAARKVLDRKLYENGVMKSESDDVFVSITEYNTISFDSKALKEDNEELFNKYSQLKTNHRYVFTKKTDL